MHARTYAALAAAGLSIAHAQAAITVYTDQSAWLAALNGADVTLETFNSISPFEFADGQTLDTGLVQITRDGSANGADGALTISAGGGFDDLDGTNYLRGETGATPHERVEIGFNGQSVFAFGADWFSPFSGDGIALDVGGQIILLDQISGFGQGFVGIISDSDTFSSISIVGNPDAVTFQELWSADNLVYAVPAPGAMALLGLGGLAAARRRR
jgi:hypothetical protein